MNGLGLKKRRSPFVDGETDGMDLFSWHLELVWIGHSENFNSMFISGQKLDCSIAIIIIKETYIGH